MPSLLPQGHSEPPLREDSSGNSNLTYIHPTARNLLQRIKELQDRINRIKENSSIPLSSSRNTTLVGSISASDSLLDVLDVDEATLSGSPQPNQSTSCTAASTSTCVGLSPASIASDRTQIRHSVPPSPSSSQSTMESRSRRDVYPIIPPEFPPSDHGHKRTLQNAPPIRSAGDNPRKAEQSGADYDQDECKLSLVALSRHFNA